MKVDHRATRERYQQFRLQAIAAHCGCSTGRVTQVIDGYKGRDGEAAQRVLSRLRELGILVEVPDDGDVDLAA